MATCTLIVDASYGNGGAAGWACWCKADGQQSHMQGGIIQSVDVSDNHEAELVACLHGLNVALQYAPTGAAILLQSDSMRALGVLRTQLGYRNNPHPKGLGVGLIRSVSGKETRIADAIRILTARYRGAQVTVRHVKGHKPGQGGRNRVNEMCDSLAKRYMRQAKDGAHLLQVEQLADAVLAAKGEWKYGHVL